MENAVKALLIAAAVLIAILIISLGLVVYNKASETVEGAGDLSEYQIHQFNEKFTKYQGTNVSGSDVNALITTIHNHNLMNESDSRVTLTDNASGDSVDIGIDPDSYDSEITATPTKVPASRRYSITCVLTNGIVSEVEVGDA